MEIDAWNHKKKNIVFICGVFGATRKACAKLKRNVHSEQQDKFFIKPF
jgi:hypothetical protein